MCQNLFFNKVAGSSMQLIKKEALTQVFRRVTIGGRGMSPLPFFKIKKSALILEKYILTKFIYGLNFLFKRLF